MIQSIHQLLKSVGTFISTVLTASVAFHAHSQTLPAFPGAEGFGALASGGRFGDVYHVTNLSSSATTPGSFSYGLVNAPPTGRTIVFDVSGYIPVSGNLGLYQPNITIAGQTAPGDGVGLKGGTFWIEKTNVIVRHVRFRNGVSADCIDLSSAATNVILDHCDMLFSTDENFSSFGNPPENLTFQWSFNAWGLSPHSAGGLWYVKNATAHHTLWAHNHTRDPKALPTGLLDWVNNVTFDYGIGFILADSTETADYKANVENCYFICPPGNTRPYGLSRSGVDSNGVPNFSLWLTNCFWDTDGDYVLDGYDHGTGILSVTPGSLRLMTNAFARTAGIPVTQDSPLVAYKKIVSLGGPIRFDANHPGGSRDEVATVLISSLLAQTHQRFTSVTNTGASNGGYGTLNSSPTPTDTDRDGMPDFWETALGSNANLDDHTNQVPAGAFLTNNPAGYTLLEEYLHFKATPHAVLGKSLADSPSSQDADLRRYTAGFTNRPPFAFTLANVSTGAVTLVSNHIVRYVPPTNYSGRASFNFTITDADGSAWTQQFLLLITTNPPPRNLLWKGDGTTNAWDWSATNFLFGATPTVFRDGDNVTFTNSGSNTPFIKLTATLSPGQLVVNSSSNFIFGSTGSLAGAMSLQKSGTGTLTISNANTFTGGTTLNGGRILFGNKSANSSALGTGDVALGGAATIELFGANAGDIDAAGVGAFNNDIAIAASETGTFLAPFRYTLGSALTGDGTFNLRVNGVRGELTGNWSQFTGLINVTSRSGTSDFRVGNTAGFPNARLNFASGVLMYSRTTSSAVISIGEFSASAGAFVSTGVGGGLSAQNDVTWRVGGLNTDATNGAAFQGTTKLIKQGTGVWTLTGNSSHTGTTVVTNGTLAVTGTFAASPVTVASNATLTGNGILGGGVTVLAGGKFAPGFSVGRISVSNSLTLASGSVTSIELNKSSGTNDSVNITGGALTLGGTLVVTNLSGMLVASDSFNLFSATNITGNFATISGTPGAGLMWSFNPTNGVLSAVSTRPMISGFSFASGQSTFQVNAPITGTFTVQASTNLVNWSPLLVTNPATMPFSWTDSGATNFALRFYRVLVAP